MPVPEFILQLRRRVGHDPIFLTGVTAVVLRDEGGRTPAVLYGRRADNGLWALPSGIVEPGEQPAATLVREVWEELQVDVEPERLALVSTDPTITYPNGDVCQFVSLTFRCRYLGGDAALGDDETLEVAW
ncbi:MAG: NUDIX hydrolase, partial [Janthinobacterium lividum]